LAEAFLLDVEQLVEGPDRALVILDRQRAERNVILAMRVIDRAARLPVHAGNFAVLVLEVSDYVLEVADLQFLAGFFQYYRPELVEVLELVEAILAVAARTCDRLSETVEHDILLADLLVLRRGTLRLAHRRRDSDEDAVGKGGQVGRLAVGRDRAVGRR